MQKIFAIMISLASPLLLLGQDSSFYKSVYAGGYIAVPEHQSWELDRAFVNGGDAYSILIRNANFTKSRFHFGDTIKAPYYIAEMELLEKKDLVQYQLYFKLIND